MALVFFPTVFPKTFVFFQNLPKELLSALVIEMSGKLTLKTSRQIPSTGTVCFKLFEKMCMSRCETRAGNTNSKDSQQPVRSLRPTVQ